MAQGRARTQDDERQNRPDEREADVARQPRQRGQRRRPYERRAPAVLQEVVRANQRERRQQDERRFGERPRRRLRERRREGGGGASPQRERLGFETAQRPAPDGERGQPEQRRVQRARRVSRVYAENRGSRERERVERRPVGERRNPPVARESLERLAL